MGISMSREWKVEIKGKCGTRDFEISVIRADFTHGFKSWGWPSLDEKRIVAANTGGSGYEIQPFVWDRAVETAHDYAAFLNAIDRGAS